MKVKQRIPDPEFVRKSNFASIVGIIYVCMEDVLSSDLEIVNQVMDFVMTLVKF